MVFIPQIEIRAKRVCQLYETLISSMIRRRTAIYFKDSQSKAEPAKEWLEKLKDRVAQAAIYVRIARAESGNFSDHKSVYSKNKRILGKPQGKN